MKNFMIFIVLLISNSFLLPQKQFFVSNDGTRDFSKIDQVNSATLNPGDIVSFAGGERFADAALICKKGVTYTSFGNGQALIGDSLISSSSPTIRIDAEDVTLNNLKIFQYKDAEKGIVYTNGGLTISDCTISGAYRFYVGWKKLIFSEVGNITKKVTITRNVIRGAMYGIFVTRPYNVEISYNEIYNMYRYPGYSSIGGMAIFFDSWGGSVQAEVSDAEYTVHIHHNDVHRFEHSAIAVGSIRRILVEYNYVHDNLDERIFQGGVTNGIFGKIIENHSHPVGSLGNVYRYNFIYNIKKYGEAGFSYGRPSLEQFEARQMVVLNTNTGMPYPHYASGANADGNAAPIYPMSNLLAGGGYGNSWIHNNIIYKCGGTIYTRGPNRLKDGLGTTDTDGIEAAYRDDLPSYFINNTLIEVGGTYHGKEWGVIYINPQSQSPTVVTNNIIDFANTGYASARYEEKKPYVDYNIYTTTGGSATSDPNPTANKATWFRWCNNTASGINEQYLVAKDSIWNAIGDSIFVSNLGISGVYIPDIRVAVDRKANNSGKPYNTIGDTYTILGQTHSLGQDPTGRSFAYDIFGNFRTTNDIGAVGAVNGSSRSPNNGLKVILEGSYSNGNLKTDLVKAQLLPSKQPYNVHPWNISGDISFNNGSENYVDWVLIQIREDLINTKYWKVGILNNDGWVLNPDGTSFSFSGLATDEYYLVIKHRNHLSIMSAQKVFIEKGKPVDYDFTDSQNKAYGGHSLAELGDGKFGMIAGDGNADGVVNVLDYSTVANNILSRGYAQGDMDMNGVMNVLDYSFISKNLLKRSFVP